MTDSLIDARDLAEQVIDGTLPYEEAWLELARAVITLSDDLAAARDTKRELHRAAQAAESLAANMNAEKVEVLDAELAQAKVERHRFRNEVKFMRSERMRLAKRIRELTAELRAARLAAPDPAQFVDQEVSSS